MAVYQKATTTTVAGASIAITGALGAGAAVEVYAQTAGIWVHVTGGTAAASAADCVYVGINEFVVIDVPEAVSGGLTAIRESGTSATVTTAVVT